MSYAYLNSEASFVALEGENLVFSLIQACEFPRYCPSDRKSEDAVHRERNGSYMGELCLISDGSIRDLFDQPSGRG